jgi:hypothetical protein
MMGSRLAYLARCGRAKLTYMGCIFSVLVFVKLLGGSKAARLNISSRKAMGADIDFSSMNVYANSPKDPSQRMNLTASQTSGGYSAFAA